MSEEKKKILSQINELPDEAKAFITGYAAGVIATTEKKDQDDKKEPAE